MAYRAICRLIGRAHVTAEDLSQPCNETTLRIESPGGGCVSGLDCKKATLALRWGQAESGWLDVTVLRLKHLPKADRFGLCDAQVTPGPACRRRSNACTHACQDDTIFLEKPMPNLRWPR